VLNLFGIAAATIDLEQRGTLGPTEMFFPRGGKHEGTGMNPSPGYAPMTMDAQLVDKVKAVGGGEEVTLTARPRDGDGRCGQVQIRFDLESKGARHASECDASATTLLTGYFTRHEGLQARSHFR
jgi:hypothetical protein